MTRHYKFGPEIAGRQRGEKGMSDDNLRIGHWLPGVPQGKVVDLQTGTAELELKRFIGPSPAEEDLDLEAVCQGACACRDLLWRPGLAVRLPRLHRSGRQGSGRAVVLRFFSNPRRCAIAATRR